MARPKLIKKGNTWYRNGKAVQAGYKYYDMNSKQWKILGKNGNFNTYKLGVRTSGVIPSPDSLTIQYAFNDLAPSVPFTSASSEDEKKYNRQNNTKNYTQVNDSIGKRIVQGYYDKYPEQYARDIQMRDQYKNHADDTWNWGCINSVIGLTGGVQWSNKEFTDKTYKKHGYHKLPLNSQETITTLETMSPGTIYQTPGLHHSVMYVGKNSAGDRQWYNTHGSPYPFYNGSQITTDSEADAYSRNDGFDVGSGPLDHGYINFAAQSFGEDFTDPYPGYIFTKN